MNKDDINAINESLTEWGGDSGQDKWDDIKDNLSSYLSNIDDIKTIFKDLMIAVQECDDIDEEIADRLEVAIDTIGDVHRLIDDAYDTMIEVDTDVIEDIGLIMKDK